NDTLEQDLNEDSRPSGAHGLANANLANALVDASQHDIHDANAAYQQANGRNHAPAHARVADLFVDALQLVFLSAKAEILNAPLSEHQNIAGLLQRGLQLFEARHFQINVREPVVRDAVGVARR